MRLMRAKTTCAPVLGRQQIRVVNKFGWVFACLGRETPSFFPDRSWVASYELVEWHGSLSR